MKVETSALQAIQIHSFWMRAVVSPCPEPLSLTIQRIFPTRLSWEWARCYQTVSLLEALESALLYFEIHWPIDLTFSCFLQVSAKAWKMKRFTRPHNTQALERRGRSSVLKLSLERKGQSSALLRGLWSQLCGHMSQSHFFFLLLSKLKVQIPLQILLSQK